MRILFLSHYFPPEVNAPASRTYEHCVRWVRAGHEVTVVTCAPNCPSGVVFDGYRNRLRPQTEWIDGIRVVRVWTLLAPNAGTARRIASFLSYMVAAVLAALWLPRPDVVLATSPQFFCGWAGVIVARLKRAPLVLEIRDIWPESIRAVGALRSERLLRWLEWLERKMYLAADHVVAVGEGYRENILDKADVASRSSVVMNGVDLARFRPRPPAAEFLDRWGLAGRFVCSYAGTLGLAHGLEVVIRAAAMLRARGRRDVRFCLVGDGAMRGRLEDEARRAGVEDMVVFTGALPKDEMPAVLASSDACLIHLKRCALFGTVIPSKIFETLAMARPVIMGVEGEARELVVRAGAALPIEPESAEALANAIERLSANPDLARRMGHAGRAYVAAHYSRDVLAKDYLRLIEAVAHGERVVPVAPNRQYGARPDRSRDAPQERTFA